MKNTKALVFRFLPVFLWAALIFFISSSSSPIDFLPQFLIGFLWRTVIFGRRLFFYIGFIGHLVNFAVLAFLLSRTLIWKEPLNRELLLLAFIIAWLYGLSDEIHQVFVPERTFQVLDLFVDGLGAALGVLVFALMRIGKLLNKSLRVSFLEYYS